MAPPPESTRPLASDSRQEQAVPVPSFSLISQARTICVVGPPALQLSVTVAPAAHGCSFGCAAKPQSRRGPIWQRSQGSVKKLTPGDETGTPPTLLAFQLL